MNASLESSWQTYFERKSHPKGEAVDFEVVGVSNIKLYEWCKTNLPAYDQLIAEFMIKGISTAGWVHGSYSATLRMQAIEIK